MCGLVGYSLAGSEPGQGRELLRAMTGAIAHRGPDADGIWLAPGVGLGHRRLSIVGLADGQQPMLSVQGDLVLVYNGEIFNFVELRRDLEARGDASAPVAIPRSYFISTRKWARLPSAS